MTPTVVLHGFTGDAGAMKTITARLTGPVDAVDLAGHGPGPHPNDAAAYSIDAMAEAVLGRHAQPVHLVGYSMGGAARSTALQSLPISTRMQRSR